MDPGHNILEIEDMEPGCHLCSIYETEEQHRDLLTPFIRQGLERNEKVTYITDARTGKTVLDYLRDDGLEVDPYLENGQLVLLTSDETYIRQSVFDPDSMIYLLRAEMNRALDEGYSALRVTGEMSWALRGLPGSKRLIEYEAKLNNFFPGSKCLALCQYDKRKFNAALLLDVLFTHPIVVLGTEVFDNFYYMPPEDILGPDPEAARLNNCLDSLVKRKRMEEALRESEARLRATINNLPFDFFMLDTDGLYVMQNHCCRETWGNFVGKRPEDVTADEETLAIWRDNNKRALAGEVVRADVRFSHPKGERFFYNIIAPIRDQDQILGILGVNIDFTERKQAEEALQETHDELVKLNEKRRKEIEERKQVEQELRKREAELETKTNELEEVNTALRVLLKRRDEDKAEIEEKILFNVKELVLPYIERLRGSGMNAKQTAYVNIVESNLNNIVSPVIHKLSSKFLGLTRTEIQIANLVKEGKTTKDIAEILNSSSSTIGFHRRNIRKKIGIMNRKANLRSHLLSM